jgi:hypothetical protein
VRVGKQRGIRYAGPGNAATIVKEVTVPVTFVADMGSAKVSTETSATGDRYYSAVVGLDAASLRQAITSEIRRTITHNMADGYGADSHVRDALLYAIRIVDVTNQTPYALNVSLEEHPELNQTVVSGNGAGPGGVDNILVHIPSNTHILMDKTSSVSATLRSPKTALLLHYSKHPISADYSVMPDNNARFRVRKGSLIMAIAKATDDFAHRCNVLCAESEHDPTYVNDLTHSEIKRFCEIAEDYLEVNLPVRPIFNTAMRHHAPSGASDNQVVNMRISTVGDRDPSRSSDGANMPMKVTINAELFVCVPRFAHSYDTWAEKYMETTYNVKRAGATFDGRGGVIMKAQPHIFITRGEATAFTMLAKPKEDV